MERSASESGLFLQVGNPLQYGKTQKLDNLGSKDGREFMFRQVELTLEGEMLCPGW